MRYLAVSLAVLSISLFSCVKSEEDDPKPEPLPESKEFFKVTVDPTYDGMGNLDNWVFATNPAGRLLDAKSYVAGDVLKLESTELVDRFTLHFLRVDKRVSDAPYFKLVSYNEVTAGGLWKLENHPAKPPIDGKVNGELKISLKNYPNQPDIPTFENIKVSSAWGYVINSMTSSGSTVDINVTLSTSTTDLIVSFSKNQHSFYKKLLAPLGSGIITLDALTDFEVVENEIMFNYPQSKYTWIGFYGLNAGDNPAHNGYILSERKDNDGQVSGFFGSVDGYEKYRTIVIYSQDNYTRTYYKFGEQMLEAPNFQTPFTSMLKTGISDFSCQLDVPYSQISIHFSNPTTKDVTWEVVGPNQDFIAELKFAFKELPEELVSKYPSLNLNQIVFKSGSATQYMDEFTYADYFSYRANVKDVSKVNSNEYYIFGWE